MYKKSQMFVIVSSCKLMWFEKLKHIKRLYGRHIVENSSSATGRRWEPATYLRMRDFSWQKRGIFRFFIFFDLRANEFLCILTYNKEREYFRTCNSVRCKNQCLKKATEWEWINTKTVSHCWDILHQVRLKDWRSPLIQGLSQELINPVALRQGLHWGGKLIFVLYSPNQS